MWLLPHAVGLDAAFVALSWQLLCARLLRIPLRWPECAALFAAVWVCYLLDRIGDASRPEGFRPTLRHQFSDHYRWPLLGLAVGLVVTSSWLAIQSLHPRLLWTGCAVGLLALLYLAAAHYLSGVEPRYFFKEACVATVLAVGVLWAPFSLGAPLGAIVLLFLAFGALAFWNCCILSDWEEQSPLPAPEAPRLFARLPQSEQCHAQVLPVASFFTRNKGKIALITAMGEVLLCSFLPIANGSLALGGLLAGSVLAIALLDQYRRHWPPAAARALADLLLLLPVLLLLGLR